MRSILILGAGVMQLPAIRAAHRLGLRVIVADGNTSAVGRKEADEFLHIDLKDHEAMADAAVKLKKTRELAAVFTAGTDFSATVAYAAAAAGLPATPYESAVAATDKYKMRALLRSEGVRVPDFVVVSADELAFGLPSRVTAIALPVVVKPADSMGSRGVVRADRWDDALGFARTAATFSRTSRVVIEGFIDGPEFSLDALVYDESVQITGFADRHIGFSPYFIEAGHTIPTALEASERERVEQEFIRGIRALGLGPGCAKGDMKLSSNGPVVGEIANRLSGGYMSGWTYPMSSGVALTELGIRVALGEIPGAVRETRGWTSAERAVISIDGVVAGFLGEPEARDGELVEQLFVTCSPGDVVRFPQSNVEKCGNVIAAAPTREQAVDAAERAVSHIVVRLAKNHNSTNSFLFESGGGHDSELPSGHWAFHETARSLAGDVPGVLSFHGNLTPSEARGDVYRIPAAAIRSGERDWSYRTVGETLELLQKYHAVRYAETDGEIAGPDSRSFLRALLRGGLQGALYVLDTFAC